jgi:metal-responsive CopG/Arc/MetJ family transcriptional regulator
MKKVLVSLPEGIFNQIHGLKGSLGESDSEVIRTMVISFLSEKGYLAKKEET